MSLGLASVGAKVVATGRTESDLRSVVDEIEAAGGEALAVVADVGDLDDGARIIAATVERFAGIDILVNNAVEAGFSMVAQLTPELWDRAYNVNVKGPVFLCNAALPYLERSAPVPGGTRCSLADGVRTAARPNRSERVDAQKWHACRLRPSTCR